MNIRFGVYTFLVLLIGGLWRLPVHQPSSTELPSGSYNPDGVVVVISGQVLLQAADDGAHGDTRVAVQGYASTATTNAEGMFRLELILSEEDISRSDDDTDDPLLVEVVFTHPGYRPSRSDVTVSPGQAVVLDETITLAAIPGEVYGRLAPLTGLAAADFTDPTLSPTPTEGTAQTMTYDDNGFWWLAAEYLRLQQRGSL